MSTVDRKLFGTDGIRGMANRYPICADVAMQVGAAMAQVLLKRSGWKQRTTYPHPRVIIGKDTRISCYMLEQALTSGICSMGADVLLLGPLPTPGVAFLVQSMRADAGIMISASHNSYEDNGIKIFDYNGCKLPDELEKEIESLVLSSEPLHSKDQSLPTYGDIGRAVRIDDALGRYLILLKSTVPMDFDLYNTTVVLDCANGAAYKLAPLLLRELGAEVIELGVSPNGTNINANSGALYPQVAAQAVLDSGAEIGISLDGDADRVILCDEKGEKVDGDQIMGICALELAKQGKLSTLVCTPMSNMGLELSLKKKGIAVVRTPVGDRYVTECMRTHGYSLGGEQSGHIIFQDFATTGDGLLAALKVLEIMKKEKKSLSELKSQISLLPQAFQYINVKEKIPLKDIPEVSVAIQLVEKNLKGRGRVFVRYSGTELLFRIMVEGEDREEVHKYCQQIAHAFSTATGNAL